MPQSLKITCAYITTCLFISAAIVLLSIIIHLVRIALIKNKNRSANKQVLFMIFLTLFGIFSFFISILLIIAVLLQIILIDGHKLDPENNKIDEIYYASFEEMEYLIVVFDAFGHLAMLTVFIVRLEMCFANSIYGYSKKLIAFMYCCLVVLFVGSFVIIIEIIQGQDPEVIIFSEIVWEILIEIMCIVLLYLFVSKLHALVKMAMGTSRRDLRLTISYNISEKTANRPSRQNSARSLRRSRFSRSSRQNSAGSINGENREKSTSKSKPSKDNNSRLPSPSPVPPITPPTPRRKPNQNVLNNQNLVNVMTKMTLLVVMAVFGSLLSVIGNIYIEIHELKTIPAHTVDVDSMWAFLLPVTDMILASLMLYLQFDFSKHVYAKLCTKMDILFLQFCGDLLDKEVMNEQKKVHREQSQEKSKSDKSEYLNTPKHGDHDKNGERMKFRTPSVVSNNGAEIPDLEQAITPRPKDFPFPRHSTLQFPQTNDANDPSFRSPSPSPTPLMELNELNEAIKRNTSIEVAAVHRPSEIVKLNDIKTDEEQEDVEEIETEKLKINVDIAPVSFPKLTLKIMNPDDMEYEEESGAITPLSPRSPRVPSPSPRSQNLPPPPLTPYAPETDDGETDVDNDDNKRGYWD